MNLLDNDLSVNPFQLFDQPTKNNQVFELIDNLRELKYINYNTTSIGSRFEFTQLGLKYLNDHSDQAVDYLKLHGQQVKQFIQKYGMKPIDFGPMAQFFPMDQFSSTSSSQFGMISQVSSWGPSIISANKKLDDLGSSKIDYENIEFAQKTPGEVSI